MVIDVLVDYQLDISDCYLCVSPKYFLSTTILLPTGQESFICHQCSTEIILKVSGHNLDVFECKILMF